MFKGRRCKQRYMVQGLGFIEHWAVNWAHSIINGFHDLHKQTQWIYENQLVGFCTMSMSNFEQLVMSCTPKKMCSLCLVRRGTKRKQKRSHKNHYIVYMEWSSAAPIHQVTKPKQPNPTQSVFELQVFVCVLDGWIAKLSELQ